MATNSGDNVQDEQKVCCKIQGKLGYRANELEAQVGQKSLTWIRLIMIHCATVAILTTRSDCL